MMELDLAYLRQWIGRQDVGEECVSEGMVTRFNAMLNLGQAAQNGTIAPQLIHFCLAPVAAATSELGEDGHPAKGGFLPPVPLPRRMWAGGHLDFGAPIRVGAMVNRRSTIRDVVVKDGRSGALCFLTVDHQITSDDEVAVSERQDIVYRAAESGASSQPVQRTVAAAPRGTWRETIEPTSPLLFRYSALTYNGHRIHYDLPYARDVEGYPGLVVHGPLQATLLIHLAARAWGRTPAAFKFRSVSPLYSNASLTLNASEEGDGLKLWTARPDGPVAMEATATW